jgi:hypothetical protein
MTSSIGEGAASTFARRTQKALLALLILSRGLSTGQQLYDNQEDLTEGKYFTRPEGRVQSVANPAPDKVNGSPRCAKFTRNRQRYDYLKLMLTQKPEDLSAYATYAENAPKVTMKVYSTAPAGSTIEIQFGSQTGNAYPEGTHSQFQAVTTASNCWEELEFHFVTTPKGSTTSAKEVDQVTVLFMPNTTAPFTFYFDDLKGPRLTSGSSAKLWKRR